MFCLIKSMKDWSQLLRPAVLTYSLPVFSGGTDTGTVTVVGETNDYTGEWLIMDGRPYVIKSCMPAKGQTTITCQLPEYAVARSLVYTGTGSETYGQFISSVLTSQFKNQADAQYALPYLTVSNSDTTPFAMGIEQYATYSLTDVIRRAAAAGVYLTWTPGVAGLAVAVAARSAAESNLFFGDGHTQLSSQTYTSSIIAKITVRETSTDKATGKITVISSATYYWHADGTVSSTAPSPRIAGEWLVKDVKEGADLLSEAVSAMGSNAAGYKIEFYSDKVFQQNDVVICRIGGLVVRAVISFRRISSSDRRNFYRAGTAAVTLTDKISQGLRSASGGAAGVGALNGNLLPLGMAFDVIDVSAGQSATFAAAKSTRGVLLISGPTSAIRDIYFYNCSSSGNITALTNVLSASGISITTSGQTITISNSSNYLASVFIMHTN